MTAFLRNFDDKDVMNFQPCKASFLKVFAFTKKPYGAIIHYIYRCMNFPIYKIALPAGRKLLENNRD